MAESDLNLYNFEDDEFVNSRYVLTSPRSLQTCDMLCIKPAALLYKPLSDFQDELLPTGLPLRAIYDHYDENEKARQRRLRECRNYRDKMIRESMYSRLSPIPTLPSPRQSMSRQQYEDAGYRSDESRDSEVRSLTKRRPFPCANATESRNAASLQRQRTANVLQRKLSSRSESALVPRPQSAIAVSMTSPKEVSRRRPRSATPTRSVSFGAEPTRSNLSNTTVDIGHSDVYKKPKRKARVHSRNSQVRNAWSSSGMEEELSDHLSKSLCLSDLPTWRPADLHGTRLRNRSLRRSLGSSVVSSGRVTCKDERILEALHSKNERESEHELSRSLAQVEWEEEKLRFQREKDIAEHRRRQLLAQRIADAEQQQVLLREKQYRDEEELRKSMMERCQQNDTKWKLSSDRQQYRKDLTLTEKRRGASTRKASQERLLSEFEQQRVKQLRNHKDRIEHQQVRASTVKDNNYYNEKMKKKRRNEQETEQHRQRHWEVERESSRCQQDLRSSLLQKEVQASLNQSRIAHAKDYTLHINAKERQQKFHRSKKNLQKMEEEMSDWKTLVNARRRLLESKAKLTSSQTVELKALRAQAEREERELKQRRSYSRLQEEAELNQQDQKDAIAYKDTRMKLVQHHKDRVVGKVRSLAATSQRMREELRKKYGKNSFDKIAFEAELQNKIGHGPSSATKNRSTVLLA